MKVALVIGHKPSSPGACNEDYNICEFAFNDGMVHHVKKKLDEISGWDPIIIYRRTYKELPDDINKLNPDFIVSFHCNAFNKEASGSEVLYYYKSSKGKQVAEIMLEHIVDVLGLPNRGIKGRDTEDRGGTLLRYTKAPCVILEPFFIDNNSDFKKANDLYGDFVDAVVNGIKEVKEKVF